MLRTKVLATVLAIFCAEAVCANVLAQRRSVFKITTVSRESDFGSPWKYHSQSSSTGTGFYIGDQRIMTNAHVVANGTYITVLRDGDARPMPAQVEFIAHDCDLALLTVSDRSYFKDVVPLTFGSIPKLQSPVSAVGYPSGGDQLSVTEGVVSRIAYRPYVHTSAHDHIMIQVSSPINPGNSGGPVFQGRHVVGVAFQTFLRAQNTGYIVPTPIIQRFLTDVSNGRYDGHPSLGIQVARGRTANPASAKFYGMTTKDYFGALVSFVEPGSSADGYVFQGDVLLKILDREIGVDGKIAYEGERVEYETLFDLRQIGDRVKFEVLRDRKIQTIDVPVKEPKPSVVRGNTYARHPRFLMWSGLVFTTLSLSYLEQWGNQWNQTAPLHLRYLYNSANVDPNFAASRDVIVLAERVTHPVNNGIDASVNHQVLEKVNDVKIDSLEQLDKVIRENKKDFLKFDFYYDASSIVIPKKAGDEATASISKQFGVIPTQWFEERDLPNHPIGESH